MDFCLEVKEVPVSDNTEEEQSQIIFPYYLLTEIMFFLHPQERNSWCCWTNPSWWNLLWPCSAVSCGQWLLIHKVAQCLIYDWLTFWVQNKPQLAKTSTGESQDTILFCLKSWFKVTDFSGSFSVDIKDCSIAISEQRGGYWAACRAEKLHAAIKLAGEHLYEVLASSGGRVPRVTVTWAMHMQPWSN